MQPIGRGERIRTSGLYVPNVALYQAKLHPDGSAVRLDQRVSFTAVNSIKQSDCGRLAPRATLHGYTCKKPIGVRLDGLFSVNPGRQAMA